MGEGRLQALAVHADAAWTGEAREQTRVADARSQMHGARCVDTDALMQTRGQVLCLRQVERWNSSWAFSFSKQCSGDHVGEAYSVAWVGAFACVSQGWLNWCSTWTRRGQYTAAGERAFAQFIDSVSKMCKSDKERRPS